MASTYSAAILDPNSRMKTWGNILNRGVCFPGVWNLAQWLAVIINDTFSTEGTGHTSMQKALESTKR